MVRRVKSRLPENIWRLAGERRERTGEVGIECARDPFINRHVVQHRYSDPTFARQNLGQCRTNGR